MTYTRIHADTPTDTRKPTHTHTYIHTNMDIQVEQYRQVCALRINVERQNM